MFIENPTENDSLGKESYSDLYGDYYKFIENSIKYRSRKIPQK